MESEHFEILLEEMRSHFQLLAEGHAGLLDRLARDKEELKQEIRVVAARVDRVETRLDRVEAKVDKVEAKVDKLTVKVDRIEKSQRAMKKQMSAFFEGQAEHESRLDHLEESLAGQLAEHP
jgi:outer membrane murein-binding lipoprotein Lpp